jgi:hypothetical protein
MNKHDNHESEQQAIWQALQELHDQLEALESKVEGLKLVCGVLCDKILPKI